MLKLFDVVSHAELQMELNGKPVTLEQLTVVARPGQTLGLGFLGRHDGGRVPRSRTAHLSPADLDRKTRNNSSENGNEATQREGQRHQEQRAGDGRFVGDRPTKPPATIVFSGVSEADGERLTLTLSLSRTRFEAGAGRSVLVQGSLRQGQHRTSFGFFGFGGRSLLGELTLSEVGTNEGDAVVGEFETKILENRGGLLSRGRRGGGSNRNDRMAKRLLSYDKDEDGKITNEELPKFFHRMFERGDANDDGVLDKTEIDNLTGSRLSQEHSKLKDQAEM